MSSTDTGRKAERAAAVYLEMRGFKIIEQNWRRPNCEIDVIASKDNVLHFIEVKYRARDDQGSGFDSITQSKVRQMQRSAWAYVDETEYTGKYTLSAIELGGPKFSVLSFAEDVL